MMLEQHVEDILNRTIRLREQLPSGVKPLAFWDFDGTILKGDCCEGLKDNYQGLIEIAIEAGHSIMYPQGSFAKAWHDYEKKAKRSIYDAYTSVPKVFAGAKLEELTQLAQRTFRETMQQFYFSSSIYLLEQLEQMQIESHIVSASPDFFVEAAAETLGLGIDRFNGIQVAIENQKVTDQLILPVSYAEGKIDVVNNILAKVSQKAGQEACALVGFGNSYSTDGAFLQFIAKQTQGMSIMINGGKPLEGFEQLICVEQDLVVSK